jgi:hypothetical protein
LLPARKQLARSARSNRENDNMIAQWLLNEWVLFGYPGLNEKSGGSIKETAEVFRRFVDCTLGSLACRRKHENR